MHLQHGHSHVDKDPTVPDLDPETERAAWAHVAPFVVWVLLLKLPWLSPEWAYAARTVVGLGLLLWLRPWRWYSAPRARNIPVAVSAGLFVFVIWVGLETRWVGDRWPEIQRAYQGFTGGVWKLGGASPPTGYSGWAPARCGWPLTLIHIAGSAVVIAAIEEFFWRGFVYRFRAHGSFLGVDLGRFCGTQFAVASFLFGIEHGRWVAGILAGVVYALVAIRTKDIWAAAIAHGVTNLALGIYVLATNSYHFW